MAFYLQALGNANRLVTVSIPQPTLDGSSDFSWNIEFEVRANGTDLPISNRGSHSTGSTQLIFLKGATLEVRESGSTTTFTHGATISNWNIYRLVGSKVGSTRTMTLFVNGVEVQSLSISNGSLWEHNNFFPLGATTRAGDFRYYSFTDNVTPANNKTYTALDTSGGTTLPPDGTLVSFQAEPWVSDGPVVTPISFSGTIPAQSFTIGESVSVDLSPHFSGTETPFTFASTGIALTGSGLTLSSAGSISGTYNGTPITGVIVTGTDTALNTAASNAFNIATVTATPPDGVLYENLPTEGENGGSPLLNDGGVPGDTVAWELVSTTGSLSVTLYTNGSFESTGSGTFSYRSYINGEEVGVFIVTVLPFAGSGDTGGTLSDLLTYDIKKALAASVVANQTFNDKLYAALVTAGYSGTINDMLRNYLLAQE